MKFDIEFNSIEDLSGISIILIDVNTDASYDEQLLLNQWIQQGGSLIVAGDDNADIGYYNTIVFVEQ